METQTRLQTSSGFSSMDNMSSFWLTIEHVIVLGYMQLPKSLLELQYAPGV